MITRYIQNAINDIKKLIDLTTNDIADIKEALHEKIESRVDEKNHLIVSFETNKSLLNDELIKLTNNSDLPLEEIMSENDTNLLNELKENLQILKDKNKIYAKFVVKINEFYTSLFDEMFKLDRSGYEVSTPKPASILRVSA